MKLALNLFTFQLGWFACVLGAALGMPGAGPVVVLGISVLHLLRARRPQPELRLMLWAMALGLLVDSLLLASGWLRYPSGMWLPGLAPYWIVAMWALFATTLNISLTWLRGRPVLAAVLGGVGGPLSYLAGARLGGVVMVEPAWALTAIAIAWSFAMPMLMKLAVRFDGISEPPLPGILQRDWRVTNHA